MGESTVLHKNMSGTDLHEPKSHIHDDRYYTETEIDALLTNYLLKDGSNLSGSLNLNHQRIINLDDPINPKDAVNKSYLETVLAVENLWDRASGEQLIRPFYDGDSIEIDGLIVTTGNNIKIGTTQWNTGDSIDGTKIADADLGDIQVSSGIWSLETIFKKRTIIFVIDGGGSAITTGDKSWVRIPFDCTIQSWELTADQEGSIVIDIWKDIYDNFPLTDLDSICSGSEPSLSSQRRNRDEPLSGWTTSISEGDYLQINVDSVATVTYIVLILVVTIG